MPQPTVLVLQHIACETPALIAEVLRERKVRLAVVRTHRGDQVPRRIGQHAGLVVMGGPMSVYEQQRLPHLRQEIRLIQDALEREKPILGVCLGSQLLASALGAAVKPGPKKEIGWLPVTLSAAGQRDPLWRGLPRKFSPLHWHGDVFELPPGAVSLVRSSLTRHQAFRFGRAAYGLLFHLEVGTTDVRRWMRVFRQEWLKAGVTESELAKGIKNHLDENRAIGREVFQRWAQLLDGEQADSRKLSIQVKRAYDLATKADGQRFLVDRLWPRGMSREAMRLTGWLKEAAPSDALRHWFAHDARKWETFRRRYAAELRRRGDALRPIQQAAHRGKVTLVFGAADTQHNNAIVLRDFLLARFS